MNIRIRSFITASLSIATAFAAAVATAQRTDSQEGVTGSHLKTDGITPLGQRTGEFCALDRALLFEDPTGVRVLYDPGVTVAGGEDRRLGRVDAILVSHNHFDHIGYRKLTQNPDDPHATCEFDPGVSKQTHNTNTAEIAAAKNSVMAVNGSMTAFLSKKIQNMLGVPADG